MTDGYIRKSIIFNMDDAHQRRLYEWCTEQSGNFSGFVKDVLLVHKSGARVNTTPEPVVAPVKNNEAGIGDIFGGM
jgi:hypothetical protein